MEGSQPKSHGVGMGGICRQAISMQTTPPRRLEQMYDLRTRLQPRFASGRWWSGAGVGNMACEERRQLLQMGHTEAAGERFYDTSGCSPRWAGSMMDEP